MRGTQTPINIEKGKYKMSGDLIGVWTVRTADDLHNTPSLLVQSGLEKFVGCIDRNHNARCGGRDPSGELRFAYIYWASFDAAGDLIKGQCVHPITGGTEDFAGVRGVINMFDTPVGDEVRTTYRGTVELNAVPSDTAAKAALSSDAASVPAPKTLTRAC